MQVKEQNTQESNPLSDERSLHSIRSLKRWALTVKIFQFSSILGAFALLLIMGVNGMVGTGFLVAAIWVVATFLVIFIGLMKKSKLEKIVGADIILPVLREHFQVSVYEPKRHIPQALVRSAALVGGDWTEIAGSDYIEGSYKGINIMYSDLHLQHKEEKREENSAGKMETKIEYTTVFKGQWLICDFSKDLAASVRIIERKSYTRHGAQHSSSHDIAKSDIETENMAFNQKFKILTSDGHSAFYLLTPHFMERLTAADAAADASTLFFFGNGKAHIALNSGRDSFEVDHMDTGSLEGVRQQFRRDMRYITDIMDILLKNDKLYKEA